jgi:hypothetical protein
MRFPLGLPVELHVPGRGACIVEIVDVSAGGVRLRALDSTPRITAAATLRFVLPDLHPCEATGEVLRVNGDREIVLLIERANPAFRAFVASL